MKPISSLKPMKAMTRKQLKRLTKWGHEDALEELSKRIGRDRAIAVWNSTAYHRPE